MVFSWQGLIHLSLVKCQAFISRSCLACQRGIMVVCVVVFASARLQLSSECAATTRPLLQWDITAR